MTTAVLDAPETGVTVTDLFCGAGGSSLGAAMAGAEVKVALNHNSTAIELHNERHPGAVHDCVDISQADPRRYERTQVLMASPECTNHSQAKGVSRKSQDLSLFDAPDPMAERSRSTMWDVPRFTEQMQYDAIIVENVVEATKWLGWRGWWTTMQDYGYVGRVLSINSQDHRVPQSRDRIYVVWVRKGIERHLDLEMERDAWCPRCERVQPCRQAWKNGRTVGRYRSQWVWSCTSCTSVCQPAVVPAETILDRSLPISRIGDRKQPIVAATRSRVKGGAIRHWFEPFLTVGAGNGYERWPGARARPLTDPVATQTTTLQSALVQPVPLLMRNNTGGAEMSTPVTEPARTMTTAGHQSLLMPYYGSSFPRPTDRPVGTVTTKDRNALVTAPAMTPAEVEAFLASVDWDRFIDDCLMRMLDPAEVAAAMAFPPGYIPDTLTKSVRVKLAGNAVTPPVMQWIISRVLEALAVAA